MFKLVKVDKGECDMELYDLRVNHLCNPLGYEMNKTVFSWKVKNAVGKKQEAARIRVGESENFETLIMDTGFLENLSSIASQVDEPLMPCKRYFWDVTVRTDKGEEAVSSVSWFETGKMDEAWHAEWITCDNQQKRHPIFKKKISLRGKVIRARLYICGLGLYEAFYENERIGEEYLTPYCNDYSEWVQYQTYDVTEKLQKEGMLSVLLGNGWYKGRFGFDNPSESGFYGDKWKLRAELSIEYEDGSKDIVGTDGSWRVERSNLTFSEIYDGEHRDDTLPKLPEEAAIVCEAEKGKLTARLSTPVTVHEQIKPKELIVTPNGETVLDLGQEFTGIFSLQVKEEKGTKIHIQTGEVLQNGNFYRDNLRTAKSEYVYISDGKEKNICPHFTFYGYRYVQIEGKEHLEKDDFTGLALYSEIPETGNVETGNPLVNQLISNIRWGMKSNFLDVPTDCPQRDERMGWTGDAQIFSAAATYLADTYSFYKKYLYDMACEQKTRGGKVPQVIPNFGKEGTSSVWGDAACIIPWNLYLFYGDQTILEEQFESMRSWVDYIRRTDQKNHCWRQEFHYGDWLALDHPTGGENGFLGGTDERFIADVSYAVSAGIVKKAAHILGLEKEEAEYGAVEKAQYEWIQQEYYTATGKCCIRTQTAQLLTLKYHLSENEEEARKMLRILLDESDGKLRTGFVGTPLLCKVLSENEMDDLAYELLLNEEFPGWLYEVKLGATTIWERWNSLDKNGCISGTQMNSLNHYAAGAVAEWIFRYAAGINMDETDISKAGFKAVKFTPRLNRTLGYAKASYESAMGLYACAWELEDETHVKVSVQVPFGGKAQLIIPEAEKSIFDDKENPMFADVRDGICYLTAGDYTVEYTIEKKPASYSIDTSMRKLLEQEEIKKFIGSMIPLETLPREFMPMSLRKLAVQFGGAQEEQLEQINEVLKKF